MMLANEFEIVGNRLFRWRSFMPLFLIPLLDLAIIPFTPYGFWQKIDPYWEVLCLFISFFGLGIRAWVIGQAPARSSGRNRKSQVADELNTSGIYSMVRHPLYLGNFFMMLGVVLFVHHVWVTIVYMLLFIIYYERIMYAEEAFLLRKFGDAYRQWSDQTPAFFPRFSLYKRSTLPFSLSNVLKREYDGFFAVIVCMFILEFFEDWAASGEWGIELMWLILLVAGFCIWLTLRIIRKKTTWLQVQGR